jgi:ABC-type Na+ transport system ATPase subunit NatA
LNERAPLIALERACVESGRTTSEALNATGGERFVALVGHFSPLFRLLRGEGRLVAGAVRFGGADAVAALRRGEVALAPFAAPALRWTARRYLVENARLALLGRRAAERRADAELAGSGLDSRANLRLCDLDEAARRRLALASAAVTSAGTVVAEAPFVELDARSEELVANGLERFAAERRLIVWFPAAPLGGRARELFERADFTVVLTRGVVSYAGPPVPSS